MDATVPEVKQETPKPMTVQDVLSSTLIEVPVLKLQGGYCRKRVDCTLTRSQAQQLRAVQSGLEANEAQLANGRYVSNAMHAIQWILEQMMDGDGKTE